MNFLMEIFSFIRVVADFVSLDETYRPQSDLQGLNTTQRQAHITLTFQNFVSPN